MMILKENKTKSKWEFLLDLDISVCINFKIKFEMENFYRDINLIFLKEKTVSKNAVQIHCLISKKIQSTGLLKRKTSFW